MGLPLPPGMRSITPHLVIKGAADAIAFYGRAFGAVEQSRMEFPGPDGAAKVGHAEIRVGDSLIFLADEFPDYGSFGPSGGSSPVTIHLCVDDARATFDQAVAAGATVSMPLQDMFWGDRYGKVVDPFGHHWSIAERIEILTDAEVAERFEATMAGAPCS